MRKGLKTMMWISGILIIAVLVGLAVTGWQIGWGPLRFLFKGFENEVHAIEQKYDAEERKGEIVFYGASNFRLWSEMERWRTMDSAACRNEG